MSTQRRISRRGLIGAAAAAGCVWERTPSATAGEAGADGGAETAYKVVPVGRVEIKDGKAAIRVLDKYAPALKGLEEWSHVHVLYWFDRNDTPQKRSILQVHPRGDAANPLTGVFACRAPVRPNLIALSVCRIKSVEGGAVQVESIDAMDGTPVLDLKPFNPSDAPAEGVRVPAWTRRPEKKE
jgi:tRNA-Thr(GGU) m(6)t(6)A37 methyltransferase TsaA